MKGNFFAKNLESIKHLCEYQELVNESTCYNSLNRSFLMLNVLNIFWGYKIIIKVVKMIIN